MRHELRDMLGTALLAGPDPEEYGTAQAIQTNAPRFRAAAYDTLALLAAQLLGRSSAELLIGFPAAPFILPLASDDPARFLNYVSQRPAHAVRLRRRASVPGAEWTLTPWPDGLMDENSYQLAFKLPEQVESWIRENEEWRAKRVGVIKEDLLSYITVYRRSGPDTRIYQLRYEPSELSHPGS